MTMKMKRFFGLALVALALFAFEGCGTATLEKGGAYSPVTNVVVNGVTNSVAGPEDMGLYVADQLFKTTYGTLTFVFDLERNNRDFFWAISHDIKHKLDKFRVQAVETKKLWASARKSYKGAPTVAGLDQLNSILGQLQRLATSVQATLPKQYPTPAK
jgi:hypothetical protein